MGEQVINAQYKKERIKIAFNPLNDDQIKANKNIFEVHNPAIERGNEWIKDVASIVTGKENIFEIHREYCEKNNIDVLSERDQIANRLQKLADLKNAQIGVIELNPEISVDEVTEIFIRINSKGVQLSQADFTMSKIASADNLDGPNIRKAIDYFCHAAKKPGFVEVIQERDSAFARTNFFQKMCWLKNISDDTYNPSYADMLRVAFTSQFKRGKLADLVSLLSGRNFETRQYEQAIIEDSFSKLTEGINKFSNQHNFQGFVMLVKSAGFESPKQIRSQMALNFAYILYLSLSSTMPTQERERFVQKWLVMSILTGRYSSSPESVIDRDIRRLSEENPKDYLRRIEEGELSDAFWAVSLVQDLGHAATINSQFNVFLAAQVRDDNYAFLSHTIKVRQLLQDRGDVHHLFPKNYLINQGGFGRNKYNQVANYTYTQSGINNAIRNKPPHEYMKDVQTAIKSKNQSSPYSSIQSLDALEENLKQHCIPVNFPTLTHDEYEQFLAERQKLIAFRLKDYYFSL